MEENQLAIKEQQTFTKEKNSKEHAFITQQTSKPQQQKPKLDQKIPNADQINETYNKLDLCIQGLDGKVGQILKKHEDEYFHAYKSHMYQVQREMKYLRDKADEEENKAKRDKRSMQLEEERD